MQAFLSSRPETQTGLAPWLTRTAVAVAAGAGLMLAASQTHAQIVYSGPINLTIPSTTAGIYLNVVTGVSGVTPGAVPGWDLNPWGSTGLSVWANNAAEAANGVIIGNGTATQIDNLPFGYVIDGSNVFGRTAAVETAGAFGMVLNSSNNYIGFRFTNEAAGTVHFGWAQLSLGATLAGQPREIVGYAFELTPNTAIPAGVVPEPSTYAMFAMGLLGLLAARRRMKS